SSGRCQLSALLISRTLAVPSIMTEPSFCGVTSSARNGRTIRAAMVTVAKAK
ncbi:TPA: hypothetical protein R8D39_004524, partial [Salmonella enterica subsp. enterica serovar Derby]|nr:hypothetical protein [Salmonella enterica subsp. enterica serovar Derby]HEE9233945.1 hypothetical protein [Salmonella enterica subsp. enterica serovar Derby]